MMDFRIVIPARFGSTRLPGKALLDVGGRPLVVRVWENAMRAGATEVLVATDEPRVAEAVEAAGGTVVMTLLDHPSGTDRIAEVAEQRGWPDHAIVVNLQGDEPMVPPEVLSRLASALAERSDAGIATMATPILDPAEVGKPSIVKVTIDRTGLALYFSRAPIPWDRDASGSVPYLRHLGLYAYRVDTLRVLSRADRGVYERVESLEQLRALELGVRIHVSVIDQAPPHGVDTEEDLTRVRRAIG